MVSGSASLLIIGLPVHSYSLHSATHEAGGSAHSGRRLFSFVSIGVFAISALLQSAASAQERSKPSYLIIVNDDPDDGCVQGYVDLRVNLGSDDEVVDAVVIASHPEQKYDSGALERIRGEKLSDVVTDESKVLVVRFQFKISVHKFERCMDSAKAS